MVVVAVVVAVVAVVIFVVVVVVFVIVVDILCYFHSEDILCYFHSEDERRQEEDHREDDGVVHAAAVDLIDGEDNAVDEYDVPVLPNEIVVHIVRMAIASDIAMLGTINRVSSAFREIATIATNTEWSAFAF